MHLDHLFDKFEMLCSTNLLAHFVAIGQSLKQAVGGREVLPMQADSVYGLPARVQSYEHLLNHS